MKKVTDSNAELDFAAQFDQRVQISIPFFQRPYVWGKVQRERMIREIDSVSSGQEDSRFLGAIVGVTRDPNPARPTVHELVDGQQRITTMYLMVLAAIKVAGESNEERLVDYANQLVESFVFNRRTEGINTKLVPGRHDWGQFRAVLDTLRGVESIAEGLSKMRGPSVDSQPHGDLFKQFQEWLKKFKSLKLEGPEAYENFVNAGMQGLRWIHIGLKDGSKATTVFEGLNNSGMPISVVDLVRNEIFADSISQAEEAELVYDMNWLPFQKLFEIDGKNEFDKYLFPFVLSVDHSAQKNRLFTILKEKCWRGLQGPSDKINVLKRHQPAFRAMMSLDSDVLDAGESAALARLRDFTLPGVTHAFVMQWVTRRLEEKIGSQQFVDVLKALEVFLVRRFICGYEPTGLLAVFRVMNDKMPKGIVDEFWTEIRRRSTVAVPSNEDCLDSVKTGPMYRRKSVQRNWLLRQYEESLAVENPANQEFTVEHICPREYNAHWNTVWTRDEHGELVDTWGNLVCLTGTMNSSIQDGPYDDKRERFRTESMFPGARMVAESYPTWHASDVNLRSQQIAEWFVNRWPVHFGEMELNLD